MALRAVLLDVDGTLVASNDAHAASWREACAEFGYDRPQAFFRDLIGMGGDQLLPRLDPALDADRDPGKAMLARRGEIFEQKYLPALEPTRGAKALVERLKAARLRCVVASSAKGEELGALLAVADIGDLIDVETTSDDAAQSKPAPDIVAAALEKSGVRADETILLGDTPYDVASAAKAGVASIALRCGGWHERDLAGARAVYDDPADLLERYDTSPLGEGSGG